MIRLILLSLSLSVFAGEFRAIKIDKLHLDIDRTINTNRHWSIPKGEKKKGNVNLTFDLSNHQETIFFRQDLDTFYTRQFRYVGYTTELAVEPYGKGVEVYIKHKSEHGLDYKYIDGYPNQNSVGIRIKFID